jgi:CRISPR-associated endonuclease/helicase Cas3
MDYQQFFSKATSGKSPFPFQTRLAQLAGWPDLLEIPTGLGKTAAVTLAWVWKRRILQDRDTPRRLVWCLPMRVLVEQTVRSIEEWLQTLELEGLPGSGSISVHTLMGGEEDLRSWAEYPEKDTILVGTQDMLLSRALMRGYGASRYQWPIQFAFLHTDALWIFDEVQLMGAGLATSSQLEAFRRTMVGARGSRSVWTSATLAADQLDTVDYHPFHAAMTRVTLDATDTGLPQVNQRLAARKVLAPAKTSLDPSGLKDYPSRLAEDVLAAHQPGTTTLVILNQVARARDVYKALAPKARNTGPERLLLHARFRPAERRQLEQHLRWDPPTEGRIVVATQAIEAGVDITSRTLFTELAPWPSLVQRFGRCNRYGESGNIGAVVRWIDITDEKSQRPYDTADLHRSRELIRTLESASSVDLPAVCDPAPLRPVLRRRDLLDLFNTDPDLSGFDLDISEYIRDTDKPPLQVFWRSFEGNPADQPAPSREELCPVSIGEAQELKKRESWHWDSLARCWERFTGSPRPGMVLMLPASAGGYLPELGFSPDSKTAVNPLPSPEVMPKEGYGDDSQSQTGIPIKLLQHLGSVHAVAGELCVAVYEDNAAVPLAAAWHDTGKAHPAFQGMLNEHLPIMAREEGELWAKSAGTGRARYSCESGDPPRRVERPCFRHELVSMLLWLEHGAGAVPEGVDPDLVAYLIAAHHGKVRLSLRAMPTENPAPSPLRFARGVWEGDEVVSLDPTGKPLPMTRLDLSLMELGYGAQGASWSARTQRLLAEHGPFRLAWLEALVRVADARASRAEQTGTPGIKEEGHA